MAASYASVGVMAASCASVAVMAASCASVAVMAEAGSGRHCCHVALCRFRVRVAVTPGRGGRGTGGTGRNRRHREPGGCPGRGAGHPAGPCPGCAVPFQAVPRMLLRSWRSLFSGRLLLLTNTVSCGGLLAAGDVLQQEWHRRKHPQSQLQLGRTAIGTLEGQSLQESWDELKEKFWEMYKADWSVWPAAQILNFLFVPPPFRVAYVNVVTLGWDTYLSYLKYRPRSPGQEPPRQSPSSAGA
ncbi:mpv17-like protein 2 isoform X2 [Zonotrichia albicollis]|uniref:mpv17-like protein 2 isoform X2 n=1 Tax=Zonotrichia albicollis TaxID=44394 RepID=UPI003D80C5D6